MPNVPKFNWIMPHPTSLRGPGHGMLNQTLAKYTVITFVKQTGLCEAKKNPGSNLSCNLRLTSKSSLPNLTWVGYLQELFYCVCWDGAFWSISCKICNVIRGTFRIISVFYFFSIYRQYCKNLLISKFKLNYFNCNRQKLCHRRHAWDATQCFTVLLQVKLKFSYSPENQGKKNLPLELFCDLLPLWS